jgi:hypothetical protein
MPRGTGILPVNGLGLLPRVLIGDCRTTNSRGPLAVPLHEIGLAWRAPPMRRDGAGPPGSEDTVATSWLARSGSSSDRGKI